jgi:hypothetical protein
MLIFGYPRPVASTAVAGPKRRRNRRPAVWLRRSPGLSGDARPVYGPTDASHVPTCPPAFARRGPEALSSSGDWRSPRHRLSHPMFPSPGQGPARHAVPQFPCTGNIACADVHAGTDMKPIGFIGPLLALAALQTSSPPVTAQDAPTISEARQPLRGIRRGRCQARRRAVAIGGLPGQPGEAGRAPRVLLKRPATHTVVRRRLPVLLLADKVAPKTPRQAGCNEFDGRRRTPSSAGANCASRTGGLIILGETTGAIEVWRRRCSPGP